MWVKSFILNRQYARTGAKRIYKKGLFIKRISYIFLFILGLITIVGCTKTETFDFSQISFSDKTYTYDGTEKTIEITGDKFSLWE